MKKLMAMVVTGIMLCMPMTVGATGNVQADLVMMNQYVHERTAHDNIEIENPDYDGLMTATSWFVNGFEYYVEGAGVEPVQYGNWTMADVEAAKVFIASELYVNENSGNYYVGGKDANGEYIEFYFKHVEPTEWNPTGSSYGVFRPTEWYDHEWNPIERPY